MKRLFTLVIAIFCAVAISAQVTGSGNGFAETFTYDNGYTFVEGQYGEVGAEWFGGAVVEDGKLKWELPFDEEPEGWFGMWELNMDLSENTDITFKYQFPADAEFGIWIEDPTGGGGEIFPTDFQLGLSEMMEYTIDLTSEEYSEVDLTQVVEVWIGSLSVAGGTFYLDDLVIGDGSLTEISTNRVSGIQVYPNPASEVVMLNEDVESLHIFNAIGQIVFSKENYLKGSSLDISGLEQGLYFIKANDKAHKLLVD